MTKFAWSCNYSAKLGSQLEGLKPASSKKKKHRSSVQILLKSLKFEFYNFNPVITSGFFLNTFIEHKK